MRPDVADGKLCVPDRDVFNYTVRSGQDVAVANERARTPLGHRLTVERIHEGDLQAADEAERYKQRVGDKAAAIGRENLGVARAAQARPQRVLPLRLAFEFGGGYAQQSSDAKSLRI